MTPSNASHYILTCTDLLKILCGHERGIDCGPSLIAEWMGSQSRSRGSVTVPSHRSDLQSLCGYERGIDCGPSLMAERLSADKLARQTR